MLIAAAFIILFASLAGALLWRLAIYALPLWCGGAVGCGVYGADGGFGVSLVAGLAAAAAILVIGHLLLGAARSPPLRAGIGLAFATPAVIAGYHAAHGIAAAFNVGALSSALLCCLAAAMTSTAAWAGIFRARRGDEA
jgi:hypothetical protein